MSKVNVLCGQTDHRIGISKGCSYANIIIATIAYSVGIHWLKSVDVPNGPGFLTLIFGVPLFAIGTLLTIIFLHHGSLCSCCCECCLGEEQVVIHDPSNPGANLVWRDGQVTLFKKHDPILQFTLRLFGQVTIPSPKYLIIVHYVM